MKAISALLFVALAATLALGQDAKAALSPPEVIAGGQVTFTIKTDKIPSVKGKPVSGAYIQAMLRPKDQKNNPGAYGINLSQIVADPKTYTLTITAPTSAKGVWFMDGATFFLPGDQGGTPLTINSLEYTIKSVESEVPTKGTAEITVP